MKFTLVLVLMTVLCVVIVQTGWQHVADSANT